MQNFKIKTQKGRVCISAMLMGVREIITNRKKTVSIYYDGNAIMVEARNTRYDVIYKQGFRSIIRARENADIVVELIS